MNSKKDDLADAAVGEPDPATTQKVAAAHLERKSSTGQDRFAKLLHQLYRYCRSSFNDLGGLLFPEHCSLCHQTATHHQPLASDEAPGRTWQFTPRFGVCHPCYLEMRGSRHVCQRCSAPLAESLPATDRCVHCKNEKWSFDRAYSLGIYRGPLRTTVILMKRPYFESLSLGMGRALADRLLEESAIDYDYIVPTPQHWLRRAIRRSNSSELMGESISSALKIPMKRSWLNRIRQTQKQGMLGGEQRRLNVRGVFAASPFAKLEGKRILLIDDILTSGSTADEMSKVLRKAGAIRIDVAVLARSVG